MRSLFEKYIKGNCTPEEYEQVLRFIQNQQNDSQLDKLLTNIWEQTLKSDTGLSPDNRLLDSIHHHIALKEQKNKPVIHMYRRLLSAAAILILGMVIGSLFFISSQQTQIATQKMSTPYGGKTQFNLPDGSSVWLNSGSTLSYPGSFGNQRIVELNGEAFFVVEKQKHPFIVKTSFGEVEVLGTEFNVKAYEGEAFVTTLEKGSVAFTSNLGKKATLQPGSQVVFDSKNITTARVETEIFTSWKDGKLIFRNEPLQNIISRLERWYNVDIELKDNKLKDLKFNGTIEMETFSEVLELIKVTTAIDYSFNRNTRVLTISSGK
jgi:ferric-dicitrate binding protein FerR (iron transport regulator)